MEWRKNVKFLDDAIKNNDIIRCVSEPSLENLFKIKNGKLTDELTTFGKEVQYLEDGGYRLNSKSSTFERGLDGVDRVTPFGTN